MFISASWVFQEQANPSSELCAGAPLELPLQDRLCAGISPCLGLNETLSWLQSPGQRLPWAVWTGREAQWRVGVCCQGQGYHRLVGLPSPGGKRWSQWHSSIPVELPETQTGIIWGGNAVMNMVWCVCSFAVSDSIKRDFKWLRMKEQLSKPVLNKAVCLSLKSHLSPCFFFLPGEISWWNFEQKVKMFFSTSLWYIKPQYFAYE